MPITLLDIIVLAVMLLSGLLAMIRGFMREILSIAAWGAAALATLYAFPRLLPTAKTYFNNDTIAMIAVVAGVFLGTLLVATIITSRISDTVLDSRVGAIDRILGFAFGVVRGFVLVVIPYMFYESFVPDPNQQAPWVRQAISLPYIKSTGDSFRVMLVRLVPPQLMGPGEQQQGRLFLHFRSPLVAPRGQGVRLVLYPGRPTHEDA